MATNRLSVAVQSDRTFESLVKCQMEWGSKTGKAEAGSVYARSLPDNLFLEGLSDETAAEFGRGSGGEFRLKEGVRPKGQVLYSSSALVCNVFDYWRTVSDFVEVSAALNARSPVAEMRFEEKLGTGVAGGPCNLDVLFRCADGTRVGVEGKFTEPFAAKRALPLVQPSYMPTPKSSWERIGLEACHGLATLYLCDDEKRRTGEVDRRFKHLDVPQLLKHVLGLHRAGKGQFTLIYMWFDNGSSECLRHRAEVADFHSASGLGSRFRAISYQEFVSAMRLVGDGAHGSYFAYLRSRYLL
jgi:hypothetical protein